MGKVNLELTESQYKKLIELVYLGNWMVNAHRNVEIDSYRQVENAVFSKYEQAGLKEDINYYEVPEEVYEFNENYQEKVHKFIKEYEDFNFWQELTYRLANRDLLRELGPVNKLDQDALEKRGKFAEQYEDEFIKNGLKNIKLDN
ncbi:hypothetical protein [Sediminibacillus massiliensis]|uniref:hypothetical protein n=1 Tax=Sediminibacillus massiliensis TaxID=1926277 RepID=UPI0009887FA5|nr:hypothetical protein [Sediminibacillus massiliensis]